MNSQTGFSKELDRKLQNLQENWKRTEEQHRQYRSSGFGLMTTVISLSAGGIAAIAHSSSPRCIAFMLFPCIILALAQQLFHYIGEMKEARALVIYEFILFKELVGKQEPEAQKNYDALHNASNCWFGLADKACVLAVLAFIILAAWCLVCLPRP